MKCRTNITRLPATLLAFGVVGLVTVLSSTALATPYSDAVLADNPQGNRMYAFRFFAVLSLRR